MKRYVGILTVAMAVGGLIGGWAYAASKDAAKFTMEDYAEIQHLYAKYIQGVDGIAMDGKGEHYADTFTDDGIMQAGPVNATKPLVGREALIKMAAKPEPSKVRHIVPNLVVYPNGDGSARVSAYIMLINVGVNPPVLVSHRATNDTVVKTPKGWRIKQRLNSTISTNTPF